MTRNDERPFDRLETTSWLPGSGASAQRPSPRNYNNPTPWPVGLLRPQMMVARRFSCQQRQIYANWRGGHPPANAGARDHVERVPRRAESHSLVAGFRPMDTRKDAEDHIMEKKTALTALIALGGIFGGVFSGGSVQARSASWPQCRSADPDRRIAGCTEIIGKIGSESRHNKVAAYVNRASAYQAKGDYDKAIEDYGKALEVDPKSAAVFYDRASAWRGKSDLERALADYDQAIAFDKRMSAAYVGRALIYRGKGEKDKAFSDLDTAVANAKKAPGPFIARASLRHAMGDHDGAIKDFTEALKRDPRLTSALNDRGACYYGKGDYDRAISDFSAAIKLDPKYAGALLNRANSWRGKKDFERARTDYQAALSIKPDLAPARKGLDDVTRILAKKANAGDPAPGAEQPKAHHDQD